MTRPNRSELDANRGQQGQPRRHNREPRAPFRESKLKIALVVAACVFSGYSAFMLTILFLWRHQWWLYQ